MPREFEGRGTLAVCNRSDGKAEKLKAYKASIYFVRSGPANGVV
jgi:hypothetical protein